MRPISYVAALVTGGLNPYSNGICSMRLLGLKNKVNLMVKVLILILMEYAL